MTPELYHPVLDCFMRALPLAYRDVPGEARAHLRFNVSGECGGSWIDREAAAAQVLVTGDRGLGSHVMSMVAIVG